LVGVFSKWQLPFQAILKSRLSLSPADGVSGAAVSAAGGVFQGGVRGRSLTSGFCSAACSGLSGWSVPASPGNLKTFNI